MAPRASKEKQLKAPDEKSKVAKPRLLTYTQMVTEAVAAMRSLGSLPWEKQLDVQPRKLAQSGKLVQGRNSHKLSDTLKKPAAKKGLSAATTGKTVKKSVKVPEPDVVKVKAANVKAAKAKAVTKPANRKPAEHPKPKPVKPASEKKAAASATKASSTPKKPNKSVKRASAEPKAPPAKKTKVSAA